jgi:hypothetical protein
MNHEADTQDLTKPMHIDEIKDLRIKVINLEVEVERLKALFNKLAEEVECGPECVSRFGDHCNCGRLKRANKVIIDFDELTNTKNETTTN